MIFVRDKGRMCNNILQYGHLYAWGREHQRTTMSMRFAYKYPYFHICDTRYHHFLFYLLGKTAAALRLIPTVSFNEEGAETGDKERIMLTRRHVMAEGWYVKFPHLFLKYKDEIKQLFAFNDEVKSKVEPLMAPHAKRIRLGVHIRRGDYARWYGGRYYYSDEQYIGIIRQFVALHHPQPVSVFICGNDPHLDKTYYQEQLHATQVVFPNGNPGEDLCTLSMCDYIIGAPSTFSLVASMYFDTPLYWVKDMQQPLSEASFQGFDQLFDHIL